MEFKQVQVKKTCLVPPEEDVCKAHKRLRLLPLALALWCIPYRTRFLFFKNSAHKCFDSIVENLKDALRKTLVEFYPIAGRLLVVREEDKYVELDCNGEGVLFIEASLDMEMEEIEDRIEDSLPIEFLRDLAQTGGHALKWPWPRDAPLFIIQVTGFACGGICISIRYNHQALDGTATWHFMKSWAEICRGDAISLSPIVMDAPENMLRDSAKILPEDIPSDFMAHSNSDLLNYLSKPELPASGCMMKCFTFKKDLICKLKQKYPGFTTYQLLSGLIWAKVTLARHLESSNPVELFIMLDCRRRLRTLQVGYVGDAALAAGVFTSAEEVLRSEINGAALIRKAISGIDEDYVVTHGKVIGVYGEHTVFPKFSWERSLNIGSSFYFPVYEDFGFGKPFGMTILPVLEDGKVYYFPGRENGDVVAYISLKSDAMKRLNLY